MQFWESSLCEVIRGGVTSAKLVAAKRLLLVYGLTAALFLSHSKPVCNEETYKQLVWRGRCKQFFFFNRFLVN